MPPQGESIGLCLEDVMLLSKVLKEKPSDEALQIFETYEFLRRERIEKAFEKADWSWETVKDKGWLGGLMMEYMTGAFLWWTKKSREEELAYDVRDVSIPTS